MGLGNNACLILYHNHKLAATAQQLAAEASHLLCHFACVCLCVYVIAEVWSAQVWGPKKPQSRPYLNITLYHKWHDILPSTFPSSHTLYTPHLPGFHLLGRTGRDFCPPLKYLIEFSAQNWTNIAFSALEYCLKQSVSIKLFPDKHVPTYKLRPHSIIMLAAMTKMIKCAYGLVFTS